MSEYWDVRILGCRSIDNFDIRVLRFESTGMSEHWRVGVLGCRSTIGMSDLSGVRMTKMLNYGDIKNDLLVRS